MIDLPDWIDKQTWADYEEMRRKIRKPLTDRARQIAVRRLWQLRGHGFSPEEVLEQSIFNSWQGLFEIRGVREARVGQGPEGGIVRPEVLERIRQRDAKQRGVG